MGGPRRLPVTRFQISDAKKATMKKKKQTRAISAAPEAMPPKPNTAAMIATMKNASEQLNMTVLLPRGPMPAPNGLCTTSD